MNEWTDWLTNARDSAVCANVQAKTRDLFSDAVRLAPNFAASTSFLVVLRSQHSPHRFGEIADKSPTKLANGWSRLGDQAYPGELPPNPNCKAVVGGQGKSATIHKAILQHQRASTLQTK